MDQIRVRSRPRVPAIDCRSGASGPRLERHLSVLSGPAVPQRDSEDATRLMRELTQRDENRVPAARGTRVHLLAPLRRLRRTLFGGRD
ncbi:MULTISPECIES: hypothetical protein [Streptomyces]|uniref:hypothetical protein n=1 Tax=Streptomyces TaxID=1883 RepID=UPI000CD4C1C9|nr:MULTISPECIES: hypothetical protein [Streptomyces]